MTGIASHVPHALSRALVPRTLPTVVADAMKFGNCVTLRIDTAAAIARRNLVADDRIAVTIEQGGMVEVRTFDLKTLKPTGRLRFATEP